MSRAQHLHQSASPWLSSSCGIIFIHVSCGMTFIYLTQLSESCPGRGGGRGNLFPVCCHNERVEIPPLLLLLLSRSHNSTWALNNNTSSSRQTAGAVVAPMLLLHCCCLGSGICQNWMELAARGGQLFNGIPLSVIHFVSCAGRKKENLGQCWGKSVMS